MSKRKVMAEEMFDADVFRISLVDSGANRTPFKILKAEGGKKPVLHWKSVFKSSDFKPELLAVAVAPGANLAAAKALIEKAGLKTDCPQEIEGATLFVQDGSKPLGAEGQVSVKLSDTLAAVVHVEKGFNPYNGMTSFPEAVQARAFFPGVELAIEVFRDVLYTCVQASMNQQQCADMVSAAADEFAKFVTGMVSSLPVDVFKLEVLAKAEAKEKAVADEKPVAKDEKATEAVVEKADLTATANAAVAAGVPQDSAKSADLTPPANVVVAGATAAADAAAEVEKTKPGYSGPTDLGLVKSEIVTEVSALVKSAIDGIAASIAALSETVRGLDGRVAKAEGAAGTAVAAVKGRVVSEPEGDATQVKKGERGVGNVPLMDTGLAALRSRK